MMVVIGGEYRIKYSRDRFVAVRPITEEGKIIGWWMRGKDDGRDHAFRLADIKGGA